MPCLKITELLLRQESCRTSNDKTATEKILVPALALMAITYEALELSMSNSVRKKNRNVITNYARNIALRRPLQTWRRCETLELYPIKSTNRLTKNAVR